MTNEQRTEAVMALNVKLLDCYKNLDQLRCLLNGFVASLKRGPNGEHLDVSLMSASEVLKWSGFLVRLFATESTPSVVPDPTTVLSHVGRSKT